MAALVAIGAMALALTGCSSEQSDPVHLKGQMNMANNGPLPKNASARVSLVQHDGDKGRIVVEQTIHELGKPPVKFDLSVGRAMLSRDGQYGLNAQVLGPDGRVRWQTPVAQSVQPLADKSASSLLMLQPTADTQDMTFADYACADQFKFGAAQQKKQTIIHLGHRQLTLAANPSKSKTAKAYTDEHNNSIVFEQASVEIQVDGAAHPDCHKVLHAEHADKPDSQPGDSNSDKADAGQQRKNDDGEPEKTEKPVSEAKTDR